MKKIFAIIAATLVAFTVNAQISSSTSRIINTTIEQEQYEITYSKIYNRIYVGGLMSFVNGGDVEGMKKLTDSGLGKFEIGWTIGLPVSNKIPLYVEAGLNASSPGFSHEVDDDPWCTSDLKVDFLRCAVPVNITYRHSLGNRMFISPYAGVQLSIADFGYHRDYGGDGNDVFLDTDANLRFGCQVGVNFDYKWLHVGLAWNHFFEKGNLSNYYNSDLDEDRKFSVSDIRLRVGVTLAKRHKERIK